MTLSTMNIFQEAKAVLDKDGKVNPLGPYGKQKLTGREISTYFRRNKITDPEIKKAVEVALDLGGAFDIAGKEIQKFYGRAVRNSKEVKNALVYANESYQAEQVLETTITEGKNLMPAIQKIVDEKGAAKVGGVMVDMFTASVLTQAYAKVNDSNKKKMEGSNIQTLVKLAQRVMGMKESLDEGLRVAEAMKIKDIFKKHKRELTKAYKTGDLSFNTSAGKKAEDDLMQWAMNNGEVKTDDPDDFFDWLSRDLEDIVKGKIKESLDEAEMFYPLGKASGGAIMFYRVKGMQKPEEAKFEQSAKLMKLKLTMDTRKKGMHKGYTIIAMHGTAKKLRDFDAVARGKSSYGDPSSMKQSDLRK